MSSNSGIREIESFGFIRLREELVEVSQTDAPQFLNNYCTQNILGLKNYEAAPAVFLTQKGKIISDVYLLKLETQFLLVFPAGYGEKVHQHLEVFLNFSEVEWRDQSAQFAHYAIEGPPSEARLKKIFEVEPQAENKILTIQFLGKSAWLFRSLRWGREVWEIILAAELARDFEARLGEQGAHEVSAANFEEARILSKIPQMGVDVSAENLVAEVGWDQQATSFNKGCYLGQETTARVQSQGRVHQKLHSFQVEIPPEVLASLPLPLELWSSDTKVGKLTSLTFCEKEKTGIGLGMILLKALEKPDELKLRHQDQWFKIHLR